MTSENEHQTGFAVIYHWNVPSGDEAAFVAAWEAVTHDLREYSGALGSRLHRSMDGAWIAYAQWPDRVHWEQAQVRTDEGLAAQRRMQELGEVMAVPTLLEEVVSDLLVQGSDA